MVKMLMALLGLIVGARVVLAEIVAVALVAGAVYGWAGWQGGALVVGLAVLLKAFEWDLRPDDGVDL